MIKNCSFCIIRTSQATLTFSIWLCDQFDLDLLTANECKSEFRFYKKDVYLLAEVLQVPDQIRCYNRVVVDEIEALCIFLKGFTYPCGYFDMLSRFARPVLQLCMKSKQVMDFIYQTHHHHLKNFNRPCLSQASLQNSTEVIHVTGAPLQICWGFFDGTIRPVSRPGKKQRVWQLTYLAQLKGRKQHASKIGITCTFAASLVFFLPL